MQSLHQSYEDWLIHEKQGKLPAPVLVLDADQGIDNMIRTYEQYKVGFTSRTDNLRCFTHFILGRDQRDKAVLPEARWWSC